MSGMNFGLAIEAAKKGAKITRRGWNGKGMWVVYRTGYPEGIPCNKNTAEAVGIPEGTLFKVRPLPPDEVRGRQLPDVAGDAERYSGGGLGDRGGLIWSTLRECPSPG